ncbi:SsrA-binding protein SmpB [Microbulbifer flavimaris]|uniref:SsrA-binding protein n=1 Tax=Microbulbifer flavimaris TaxID=1781068 RepID=A0ABX4HZM2_9GAMM|nr:MULTISPECIES: SsrA-binding protein SmpB [Microbulbifer]KUJ83419.1 SsrA-binding protein [Microbulbifer sp. ZGT114]PCO05574.1 SsrA-binding protein SmpB [Microbulbifer flavimaris]
MAKKKKAPSSNTIALNKKARHDYSIEEKFEAGVELQGWEVKSCREGKAQLTDSYVLMKDGQAWLLGARIQPLPSASTHFVTEPDRTRRLLLHKKQLAKLKAAVDQKGYALVATALYWKKHLIKCEIALGKGKAQHDKRDTERERDWNRQKQRLMRTDHR